MSIGYKLLVQLALQNDCLDPSDRVVLKDVVYALDLQGSPTLVDVNDKIIVQQRLEAKMIYLTSKYEHRLDKQEIDTDEIESASYLNLPNTREDAKKYTLEDKKYLVRVEADFAVARRRYVDLKALVSLLNKLSRTVQYRNQKLDQLAVNYRREKQVDENS